MTCCTFPRPTSAWSPTSKRSTSAVLPWRGAALALTLVLLAGGCTSTSPAPSGSAQPSGVAPTSAPLSADPQATDAVELLPDPSEIFPEPPILEEGDVPPFEETQALTGSLEVGTPGDATSATIGGAGGSIETSGLRIDFAPETLAAETALSVSAAPISSIAGYGDAVTPITPLYTVAGADDVTLAEPATVTLAADIPAGATALALYYDDSTGTLTPLSPIGQDAASLTAGATHFSSFLGALVDLAKLPAIADSGFRPGTDDWQFPNNGSYIEPGGHCEGQSVSAIWYYVTQRKGAGAPSLHGRYDNNGAERTPNFWFDDAHGYRLASVVQHDPYAVPFTALFLRNMAGNGRLTYEAFRAAIAFSGEPQLISIRTGTGDEGHAMIVYRVIPERLLIADPNFPGRVRSIRYDPGSGTLDQYTSGANAADIADDGPTIYTRFAYIPWRASSSEAAVARHWAEFQNGIVGDDIFPGYTTFVRPQGSPDDAPWTELPSDYATNAEALDFKFEVTTQVGFHLYRGTESIAGAQVQLDEGPNDIGVIALKKVDGESQYVDFQRFRIVRGGCPADPQSFAPCTTEGSAHLVHTLSNLDPDEQGSGTLVCPFSGRAVLHMDGGQWDITYQGEGWHHLSDDGKFVCGGETRAAYIAAGSYTIKPLELSLDAAFTCDMDEFLFPGLEISGEMHAYCSAHDVYTFSVLLTP